MITQKTLIRFGILAPRKTACYRNNICITSTKFVWTNPITWIYLLITIPIAIYKTRNL